MKNALIISLILMLSISSGLRETRAGSTVERRYQAEVISVDLTAQSVVIRHKPTGYETTVFWNEKTRLSASDHCDIDEIPAGWCSFWGGKVDPAARTVSEISRIQPLATGVPPPVQADPPKAGGWFRAVLVKVPFSGQVPDTLLSKDKTTACFVGVNGQNWKIMAKKRPTLIRDLAFTPAQLKPGLGLSEVVYIEDAVHPLLISAAVALNGFKQESEVGHGTGTTAERLTREMVRLRESYAKVRGEIHKVAPMTMRVSPEIALPGEPITLSLEAWAAKSPNPDLILNENYLRSQAATTRTLKLDWKAGDQQGELTHYTAVLQLPELPVGQHTLQWNCDIGGDIKEFWRGFAVADKETLVVMLHFTAGTINTEFEEFRLPYDYWEESALMLLGGPFGDRKTPGSASAWRTASREFRRRGAMPDTHIIQGNYAGRIGWPAPIPVQFCSEPPEVRRAVLKAAVELMPMLGFSAGDIGCTGYEFDTATVNLAREAGIHLIGSMCIHQNWQDGAWGINHSGRPLRPYFAASDDFRKAGPGGKGGTVMVSEHDKSILWTEYGLGVFEPAWLERDWPGGGGGGRSTYDEVFMSRDFDLMNASWQNMVNQKIPYFASIGIEFSKPDKEEMTTKSNALMIRYTVDLARKGKVVFCNQSAAADFYRRHYHETPETLFYDADFWCGIKATESITSSWKPVDYPDLIQIENARYSAYFKRPMNLPEYHWDYTKPWNYPNWGNDKLPRNQVGVLVPGEHDKFAVTPKITDTRPLKVGEVRAGKADGLHVTVTVESDRKFKALPIALWDLPRECAAVGKWWNVKGANRFVPIRAPYTGNLNGILEVDVKPGHNVYQLTITTPKRELISQDLVLGEIHGKVFERDGGSMAYLWPMRPWDIPLELTVPEGKSVQFYAAPKGERVDLKSGTNILVLPKEKWARIVGFTHDELRAALKPAASTNLQATGGKPDDNHLLNNIDSLKTTPAGTGSQITITELQTQLATLWDRGDAASQPLDIQVVHTESKNGIKVEGIYINGYKGPAGRDRLFFYYARPEKIDGKIPAYIELTGGSEPEKSLWMAGVYKCAVIDVEWRGTKNKYRSQWPGCDLAAMKSITSLKDNLAYRLVTAIRRAIDFLEQQPGIDTSKIGCGGGSMGGYYTLLTAGVDERVSFGQDELGAGHLEDTNSALGQFALDPEHKTLWLRAFDPLSFASRTKARMFMNLSADDFFFWLGDAEVNYQALPGEKRLAITPNFNHNDGAFGKKKPLAVGWLEYACGREISYPEIKEVSSQGAASMAVTTPDITGVTLCWSPGSDKLVWSARYWLEVPAVKTDAGWKAEVPAAYAGLARVIFMTGKDARERTASSLPVFISGIDPSTSQAPLWADGSLWDKATGISAWRQIGPNAHSGVPARVEPAANGRGLRIFPGQDGKPDFSLVSNSPLLASGQAGNHRGIRLMLNGGNSPGELKVILVKNFGAATGQQESTAVVPYKAGGQAVDLIWDQFKGASSGTGPAHFDSIRLEGARPDGTPLEIGDITFIP